MTQENSMTEEQIISTYQNYRRESKEARRDRMELNRLNYSVYHLNQDWSYKKDGQSKEFLPKQAMATEQLSSFITQGLVDIGSWFSAKEEAGLNPDLMQIKPSEIQLLLQRQLEFLSFHELMGNAVKLGALGALMIFKVGGKYVPKEKYSVETELKNNTFRKILVKKEDKQWQLDLQLVRQMDYFPDPTGNGLYELQDIWTDFFEVERKSQGKDAIYDAAVVEQLKGSYSIEGDDRKYERSRETGQNISYNSYRKQVKITEIWGNILDQDGNLMYENCVTTIANDRFILRKPTPNPYWHKSSPFVVCPLITVPHSVWHKALMDAPSMLNRSANELWNLMFDGALMGVHGIKQIRTDWMEDVSQITEGITAGDTLEANASCPPGMKVLERIDTSAVPNEALNMYNLLNQELNAATLSSDLRSGVTPFRAVKATEVVEQSQTLTSMHNGLVKNIEQKAILKLLEKGWQVMCQHMNDLDSEDVKALLGPQRAQALAQLSAEDIFAGSVSGTKFKVSGLTAKVNAQNDLRKWQGMLQTIASVPILFDQFTKGYDINKLLNELFKSLQVDVDKIKLAQPELEQPVPQEEPNNNAQTQIPQASATAAQQAPQLQQAVQGTQFPGSPATQGQ